MPSADTHCPHCGSETELRHNGGERRVTLQKIPPTEHWRECLALDCKTQGPHRPTPEGANLAFLHRAAYRSAEPAFPRAGVEFDDL